jgi:serine/threonine protein kinase
MTTQFMTVQQWERVKGLLHQAMQLAPQQRAGFLDQACSFDAALRAEVESLLLVNENVRSSFLQSPPLADALPANGVADDDRINAAGTLEPGQIFAQRFQLVLKLGEGGMGQVWLAEQTFPVRRQVALKLIKAGMYDEGVVQRFLAERQSLAIMDHPAIAKVFDAGATPQGQPYFVMEYVPGLTITEYCDQKKLKISDRLELFIQVCEGVQHAHQKAIIHRDLKPANILVVEVDGKPVPRIIDFGLAKATTPQVEGESLFTQLGHFVGTPGYMSPEQADPRVQKGARDGVQDIDTRTDVYSLGVVLYVLLVGLQPFETKQRQKEPLDELLRKLREEDPPSPSNKVSADRDTLPATAEARGTEPKQLVNLLRGDLDCIAMKSLEKDRTRRYGTPSELAVDIRRYLNHEPVVARPASAGYRLRKYTRRHRVAVGVAAGLVLLLAAFSILQAVQLRRITRERDRANRERDRATRITDFMTDMFKVSDPSQALGNSVTAREILDKASKEMGTGLAKDPEVQSQMMRVMATTYLNLGLYARAHELAKRALDTRMTLHGPDDPETLELMSQIGGILDSEGRAAEAEKLTRQALARERLVLGPEDLLTLDATDRLAVILEKQAHYEEVEKLERGSLPVLSRKLGPEDPRTLRSMRNLALALKGENRFAESENLFGQLLETDRRVLGLEHPQTLAAMHSLANLKQDTGRNDEAEALYRETLAIEQRVLGPDHPNTIQTMLNLANAMNFGQNRHAEAEVFYRKLLEVSRRVLGPDHLETTRAKEGLANSLSSQGHHWEAETLLREILATRLRVLGPDNTDTLLAQYNLADVLYREDHFPEADKLMRETLKWQARTLGDESPDTLASKAFLARILTKENHAQEAEALAREAFESQLHILGPQDNDTINTLQYLGTALIYERRYADATRLFAGFIEKLGGANKSSQASAWYAYACVETAANRPDDALQYLQEAINRGYKDADGLMADDDLKKLHSNPRFQQLVADLKTPNQKISTQ